MPWTWFAYQRHNTATGDTDTGVIRFKGITRFLAWIDERNKASESTGSPWRYRKAQA